MGVDLVLQILTTGRSRIPVSHCLLLTVWESQGSISGPVGVTAPEVERLINGQQLFNILVIKLYELYVRYAARWDQLTNLGLVLSAEHLHRIRSGVTPLERTLIWSMFAQRLTKMVKGDTPLFSATLFTISL